jgi:hypothetical protein
MSALNFASRKRILRIKPEEKKNRKCEVLTTADG